MRKDFKVFYFLYKGVKTGHTSTAGSCLCTFKKIQIKNKFDY